MDLLSEWPTVVPSMGVLGVLVWLIIHLMRQSSGDRGDYQQQLILIRQQHSVELTELAARYDTQMTDLRKSVGVLRAEVADLKQRIEDERKARWFAEDTAARFRRMVNGDVVEGGSGEPT